MTIRVSVARGAGKPHEIGEQIIHLLDVILAYRDADGYCRSPLILGFELFFLNIIIVNLTILRRSTIYTINLYTT